MSNFEKTRLEAKTDDNPHSHHTDGSIDEDAYRRGVQHGAYFALKAVREGMSLERLERWQMAIYRWRFIRSHKKRIWPPRPDAFTPKELAEQRRRWRVERELERKKRDAAATQDCVTVRS